MDKQSDMSLMKGRDQSTTLRCGTVSAWNEPTARSGHGLILRVDRQAGQAVRCGPDVAAVVV